MFHINPYMKDCQRIITNIRYQKAIDFKLQTICKIFSRFISLIYRDYNVHIRLEMCKRHVVNQDGSYTITNLFRTFLTIIYYIEYVYKPKIQTRFLKFKTKIYSSILFQHIYFVYIMFEYYVVKIIYLSYS